jgi:hypothetical protein
MQKHLSVTRMVTAVLVIATAVVLSGGPALAAPNSGRSECQDYQTCLDIGVLAYVYGYPLVMVEMTKQVATNVSDATTTLGRAPINQFSNNPLPDASYTDIVLPSVSTPYSNAFLDLSKEPVVLHLPDLGDRFFLMQVLDAWTNVGGENDNICLNGLPGFCGLGTRYNTQAGDYAFVGPDWVGTLPPGITQVIQLPTNTAWIAGRTLTTGSSEDLEEVKAIQKQYTLTPLNHFGKRYSPPAHSPVDPTIDMVTSPRDQVATMDAGTFFKLLAELMRSNPPLPDDTTPDGGLVALLAKIGLVPGRPFNINQLNPVTRQALEDAVEEAQQIIVEEAQKGTSTTTYWNMSTDLGAYGRQYLLRAAVAYSGLGANLYKDAIYAGAYRDSTGADLNGAHQYVLHFAQGQFPPVDPKAFWSVTLYNRPQENLFASPNGRNALGIPEAQDHSVCENPDGSLTFYIQEAQPDPNTEPTKYCNWLPAPPGQFILLLRMYMPDQAVIDQQWVPPAVQRVD